jgi:hypothetical protein
MKIGAAKTDITPGTTLDLSGFAARQQPMTGVLDPISATALYVEEAGEKLLWVSFDVLALGSEFVRSYRQWAQQELGLQHVLLSATHTHAAPATVALTACGRCDDAYHRFLHERARRAARSAIARAEPATLTFAQSEFQLAIDRRGKPSAHVDSTLTVLGWKRANGGFTAGEFAAAMLNYPMHPVSLGASNRQVSADWCGAAAEALGEILPGHPTTLVSNGACGNLNPPARPVSAQATYDYGRRIAEAAGHACLRGAGQEMRPSALRVAVEHVELPLEPLAPQQIDQIAEARVNECQGTEWESPFREAMVTWRDTQKALIASGGGGSIDIELFAVDFGPVVALAISGELFSRFTAILRQHIARPLFVVGYANAVFGYIPTAEAYEEGGYEVDQAHFFYNSLRPQPGGLELLADRAAHLIETLR